MGEQATGAEKKLKNIQDFLSAEINEEYCGSVLNIFSFITQKWTMSILAALETSSLRNYELLRKLHGISPKMLNEVLKRLVDYKMVHRTVYPEVPPKVEYELTEFGRSLYEPTLSILHWAVKNKTEIQEIKKQV
ncbi:DNA-binding HxlR family transcriptional regulator [Pedobacter sp. CG_S7]|uniref:winged helix-turn-helix transcriptional regulator n=1 Tax=Pedobacter sp. CG_S7 TaxID=3143930 RepID=UPI00339511B0